MLKRLQLIIPIVGSIYFFFAYAFGSPSSSVLGVFMIFTAAITIAISGRLSYDGQMVIKSSDGGGKIYSLELNKDPTELANQTYVAFKVTHDDGEGYITLSDDSQN